MITKNLSEAELCLRARLAAIEEPTLVLINQPTTTAVEVNSSIIRFVDVMTEPAEEAVAPAGREVQA